MITCAPNLLHGIFPVINFDGTETGRCVSIESKMIMMDDEAWARAYTIPFKLDQPR